MSEDCLTDYELGRLEARNGHKDEAKRHLELVLSGKVLEVNWSGRSGESSVPFMHSALRPFYVARFSDDDRR